MSVTYYAACDDCKAFVDMDKFYFMFADGSNRHKLLAIQDDAAQDKFKCALLATFCGRHLHHHIRILDEQTFWDEKLDEAYLQEVDAWPSMAVKESVDEEGIRK